MENRRRSKLPLHLCHRRPELCTAEPGPHDYRVGPSIALFLLPSRAKRVHHRQFSIAITVIFEHFASNKLTNPSLYYYTDNISTRYISSATARIRTWINKTSTPGQSELNRLATTHRITIDKTDNPEISICGCDIANGQLRILFAKDRLGYNINDALANLQDAVNAAGIAATGPEGAKELDFNAKRSIRDDYDAKIDSVSEKIKKVLALPVLTLVPNFEANFAAITASELAAKESSSQSGLWDREWQKHIGALTLQYFSDFAEHLEYAGFGKDDMLQEGFKDVIEKNEIAVRVVERLERGTYNECGVEEGVVVLRTTPGYWGTNVRQAGEGLMDLL